MLHLLKKEVYTQRYFAYFAPLFLLPYFLSIGKNISGSSVMTVMMLSLSIGFIAYFMVMYSNFNTNETERNENRLLLSLPITRKELMIAKYAMVLFWWLIAFGSSFVFFIILKTFFHFDHVHFLDARIIPLSICFTYVLTSIFYPLHFRFGYRAASLIGILMFFAVTSSVGSIFRLDSNWLTFIAEHPLVSVVVFSAIFGVISYSLSLKIFLKKDY